MPPLSRFYRHFRWLSVLSLFSCATPVESASQVTVKNETLSISMSKNSPFSVVSVFSTSAAGIGFGGVSGLLVSPDGKSMLGVSDAGRFVQADFVQKEGVPVGLKNIQILPLLDEKGVQLPRGQRDSEGLSRAKECQDKSTTFKRDNPFPCTVVSFEGRRPQIRVYDRTTTEANANPKTKISLKTPVFPPDVDTNQGLESFRLLPNGQYMTFMEFPPPEHAGAYWGWIGDGDGETPWKPLKIKTDDSYGITDLDVLPTGDVLLLKRNFDVLNGWRMKIERIKGSTITPNAVLEPELLLSLSGFTMIDNMEGMSIVPQPDGKSVWIYIISDDNFNRLQKTMMIVLELPLAEKTPDAHN